MNLASPSIFGGKIPLFLETAMCTPGGGFNHCLYLPVLGGMIQFYHYISDGIETTILSQHFIHQHACRFPACCILYIV